MKKKNLVIITAAKNEGCYIEEWIRFHVAVGVPDMIIFDNDSTDGTERIIASVEALGSIRRIPWQTSDGISPQLSAFNEGLRIAASEYEWGAFIDVDEFLVPIGPTAIAEWIANIDEDVSAIALCQRVFGSSGQLHYEDRPVIERFTHSSAPEYDENRWFKTIYRLNAVEKITGCHTSPIRSGRYIYPNGQELERDEQHPGKSMIIEDSVIQLHHYILKSREEFERKRARGGGAGTNLVQRLQRYEDDSFFTGRDARINMVENLNAIHALEKMVSQ